jgi:hypothetical protein
MLETHLNMNQMGSGLGLCIAKQVANLLGYKISFTSQYGCGSIFSIDIPLPNKEFIPLVKDKSDSEIMREDNNSNFSAATIGKVWNLELSNKILDKKFCLENDRSNLNIMLPATPKSFNSPYKNSAFINFANDIQLNTREKEKVIYNKYFLIIDDLEIVLNSVAKTVMNALTEYGISDIGVIRGVDGVDALKEVIHDQAFHRIICIFIDEHMNYINGNEAISMIRMMERNGRINKQYICKTSSEIDEHNLADTTIPKPIPNVILKDVFKTLKLI